MKKNNGFTLIELVLTIAIASITLTFAVSSFRSVVVTNRVTTEVNDFVAGMSYARSEAVKRAANVTVVASNNSWASGWDIGIDANSDGDLTDGADTLLRTWRSQSADISWVNDDGLTLITVDARGGIGNETGFVVQPTGDNCVSGTERVRDLDISISGRVSVSRSNCD